MRNADALDDVSEQVHFILAACENMVDGKGYRPSDVVSASNGKTVEVRRCCHTALPACCGKAGHSVHNMPSPAHGSTISENGVLLGCASPSLASCVPAYDADAAAAPLLAWGLRSSITMHSSREAHGHDSAHSCRGMHGSTGVLHVMHRW